MLLLDTLYILYVLIYYWTDSFGQLLTAASNIPGHEIKVNFQNNVIAIDTLKGSLVCLIIGLSIVLSSIILYVIYKKKSRWFIFYIITPNPYKLVCKVVYLLLPTRSL